MSERGEPMSLEEATRVEGEGGRYSARISDGWEVWGPNGGYLGAIALRAAGRSAAIARPVGFYCHFLRSPAFDEVELEVETLKRGRRWESLAVRMTQGGALVLFAVVTTAAEAPGYEHQDLAAPDVSRPEESAPHNPAMHFRFFDNLTRRRPESPREDGAPVLHEWVRFEPIPRFDDPFVDAARPLILLDTFGWPAVWNRYRGADYVAPNLDSSAWFHRLTPAGEWLLIDHHNPIAADGLLGVSGRVWDERGRLVATGSAQLCCVPAPDQ